MPFTVVVAKVLPSWKGKISFLGEASSKPWDGNMKGMWREVLEIDELCDGVAFYWTPKLNHFINPATGHIYSNFEVPGTPEGNKSFPYHLFITMIGPNGSPYEGNFR